MQEIHFRYAFFVFCMFDKRRLSSSHSRVTKKTQSIRVPAELEEQAIPGAADSSLS